MPSNAPVSRPPYVERDPKHLHLPRPLARLFHIRPDKQMGLQQSVDDLTVGGRSARKKCGKRQGACWSYGIIASSPGEGNSPTFCIVSRLRQ